jgi:type 1 glutamine amidotransferase
MRSYLAVLLAASFVPVATGLATEDRIRTLIVTGANNHDWAWTCESLAGILRESPGFEVAITRNPAADLAKDGALDDYDLVVLDYNGERFGDAADANLLAAIAGGKGLAVIHAANNAFDGFAEYEQMVGHLWRRHAATGHGTFHAFDLRIDDYAHPITRGLPEVRRHPDELYHGLWRAEGSDHVVLASAFSSEESGGSGNFEPMILAGSYGQGRVFHTPLGHVWPGTPATRASHEDPQFGTIVRRGCEWAATGDVKDEWIELFNGRDLEGWSCFLTDGKQLGDVWSVKDGAIVCTGRPAGYLFTHAEYDDYILELDWRWSTAGEGGRNSGVLLRLIGEDRIWPKSLEAQLMAGEAGDFWQIEEFAAKTADDRRNGRNTKKTHGNEKPLGEWNRYRITVNRGDVVLAVNGQVLNEATEVFETKGRIALQSEGAEIHFRNVRLLPLRGAPRPR